MFFICLYAFYFAATRRNKRFMHVCKDRVIDTVRHSPSDYDLNLMFPTFLPFVVS